MKEHDRRVRRIEELIKLYPHLWDVYRQQLHARHTMTFTQGRMADEPLVSSDDAARLQAWYDLSRA